MIGIDINAYLFVGSVIVVIAETVLIWFFHSILNNYQRMQTEEAIETKAKVIQKRIGYMQKGSRQYIVDTLYHDHLGNRIECQMWAATKQIWKAINEYEDIDIVFLKDNPAKGELVVGLDKKIKHMQLVRVVMASFMPLPVVGAITLFLAL